MRRRRPKTTNYQAHRRALAGQLPRILKHAEPIAVYLAGNIALLKAAEQVIETAEPGNELISLTGLVAGGAIANRYVLAPIAKSIESYESTLLSKNRTQGFGGWFKTATLAATLCALGYIGQEGLDEIPPNGIASVQTSEHANRDINPYVVIAPREEEPLANILPDYHETDETLDDAVIFEYQGDEPENIYRIVKRFNRISRGIGCNDIDRGAVKTLNKRTVITSPCYKRIDRTNIKVLARMAQGRLTERLIRNIEEVSRDADMDAMKLMSLMDYMTEGTFHRSRNGKISPGLIGINPAETEHLNTTIEELRKLQPHEQTRLAQRYFELMEQQHGDIDYSQDANIALAVMHPEALLNPDLIVETKRVQKRYDTNGDGKLSAREAVAKALTRFEVDEETKLCFPLTKWSIRPRSKGMPSLDKTLNRLFYGISDNFGDDRSNGSRYHQGTDIYTIGKGQVLAIADGVVVQTSKEGTDTGVFKFCKGTMGGTGGKTGYITIHHRDLGVSVTYAEIALKHVDKINVGQRIRAGQPLGTARECGMGHFESRLGNIGKRRYSRWLIRDERPEGLVDLGPFLIQLRKNGSYCE